MRRWFLIAAALLSISAGRPGLEIRGVYEALEQAVVMRDADAALTRVSTASLEEWAQLRSLVLQGSRADVQALAPGPRLVVLGVRHVAPVWLLRDGTPRELAAHAVRAGLADPRAVVRLDLTDVAVLDRTRALAQIYASGFPSGLRVGFVREQDRWRFDLPATLAGVGRIVSQVARTTGLPEGQVILNLLTALTGEPVTDAVWHPLAPRAPAARVGSSGSSRGRRPRACGADDRSWRLVARAVLREERLAPVVVRAGEDRGAGVLHQAFVEAHVVGRDQDRREDLVGGEQMVEVRAGKAPGARRAIAGRIDGITVATVATIGQPDPSASGEGDTGTRIAGRDHAVEQVHAVADRRDEILGQADAHQVAGLVLGEQRRAERRNAAQQLVPLADRDAADRIADEVQRDQRLGTALA